MQYLTDQAACSALANLCRDAASRTVGHWRTGHPSRWTPYAVKVPQADEMFTSESAWEFVAASIDAKFAIKVVTLNEPRGATAYELVVPTEQGRPDLYIKITLGKSEKFIIGRSFHYSERS